MTPSILVLANKDLSRNTRIERQVRALKKADWKVHVYCLAPPEGSQYPEAYTALSATPFSWMGHLRDKLYWFLTNPQSRRPDLPNSRLEKMGGKKPILSRASFPLSYLLESWSFLLSVKRIAPHERYDVVQAHDHFTIRAASSLAKKWNAQLAYDAVELPYAITEAADQALFRPVARALLGRERRLLSNARIFTVSPGLASAIKQRYRLPEPFVVRNCSLTASPSPHGIKDMLGLSGSEKLIIYLNSILPDRGVSTILQAAEALPAHIHFAFLGPKPNPGYFDSIKTRCQSPSLSGRIHFPEQVKACDLSQYISSADVGVIATRGVNRNLLNCLPNRLFEMIMAGLPLVVSNLPDIRNLVTRHNLGLIFDQGNSTELMRSLMRILEAETRDSFAGNVARASSILCWENEGRKYVGELSRTLSASLRA